MTKSSIAFTELAEKGGDVDLVRDMLQLAAQKLMEIDVEALSRAQYGERTAARENARNGYRERPWETRAEWQLQRRYMQLEGMNAVSDNQTTRLSAVIS